MLLREHELEFLKPVRLCFLKSQQAIIKDILSKGIKQGVFRKVNQENTSLIIFSSIRGDVLFKLSFGVGSGKVLSDSLFELISNGLRGDTQ